RVRERLPGDRGGPSLGRRRELQPRGVARDQGPPSDPRLRRGGVFVSVGFYGQYGGWFVPETLVLALDELTAAWNEVCGDVGFCVEFDLLFHTYVGWLMSFMLVWWFVFGKRIYFKCEDLLHTNTHKLNN